MAAGSASVYGKPLQLDVEAVRRRYREKHGKETSDIGLADRIVREFKRLTAADGLLKELKRRRFYEKPGAAKRRKRREADRKRRRSEARTAAAERER